MDLFPTFLGMSLAFFLASTSNADDVSRCPTNLPRDRYLKASSWNVCYQFHMEERAWRTASRVCRRLGGRIVTIRESRIQKFLVASLTDLDWPRNGLWIGANDRESEMDWRWVTGEKVRHGYSNWAPGQPSCGFLCVEDCAVMRWKERDGRWHDYRCHWVEDYSFICEFDMLPPTTTTTTTTQSTTTSTTTTTTAKTTTNTPTTTTDTSTTSVFNSTREEKPPVVISVNKLRSDYLLNSSAHKNLASPNVHQYDANNARHGQVKHVESQSSGLTSGSLVGLVVGILIGLSCAVCFIFFILLRRRRRKQSIEEDPRTSYENPYYAETPNVVYRMDSKQREDDNEKNDVRNDGCSKNDIGCASGGYNADAEYLEPQKKSCSESSHETSKMKLPPPPSPLHSKTKHVLNNYDTPPTLTAPKRIMANADSGGSSLHRKSKDKKKSTVRDTSDKGENYYSEINPCTRNKYTYDIPQSRNELDYANSASANVAIIDRGDDDSLNENDYYNEEENMYESLDNLTAGGNGNHKEETKRLMNSATTPVVGRDETEDMYVNAPKENAYIPMRSEGNIYY